MKTCLLLMVLILGGCDLAYNDPNRFWPHLPPDVLARIEPPLTDGAPGAPGLGGYHPGTAATYIQSRGAYAASHGY